MTTLFDTVLSGKSVTGSIVGTRNDLADVSALAPLEDSVRELSGAAPEITCRPPAAQKARWL